MPPNAARTCFNPRTREGGDLVILYQRDVLPVVSIHAPAWGATQAAATAVAAEHGVSTHAPAWGATNVSSALMASLTGFNPRTRVGCDQPTSGPLSGADFVSIHAPAWGATPRRPSLRGGVKSVSIHAPAWGATLSSIDHEVRRQCFNPRTRVGCDRGTHLRASGPDGFNPRTRVGCDEGVTDTGLMRRSVSIHAPAWGATSSAVAAAPSKNGFNPRTRVGCDEGVTDTGLMRRSVSIHAPAWGATCDGTVALRAGVMFQSTHPRGVRRESCQAIRTHHPVSIHAPAWGATGLHSTGWRRRPGFNPRTRVGCDMIALNNATQTQVFQSTHPRGVRLIKRLRYYLGKRSFNPRTRVGCDDLGRVELEALEDVSIHAPAWGATFSIIFLRYGKKGFNPRTRVGCDLPLVRLILTSSAFQSTHPRGVRLRGGGRTGKTRGVSIHAPAWGAT